jgi:DNA-binding Xre family transcriptional regulator
MGRPRLYPRDAEFWESVRSRLDEIHATGTSWIVVAKTLGISKQALSAFRKRRSPALEAEALLNLCAVLKVPLLFKNETIRCVADDDLGLQLQMEFDDSFELRADPNPRAILTRKPPSRASYIGIRVEQVPAKS